MPGSRLARLCAIALAATAAGCVAPLPPHAASSPSTAKGDAPGERTRPPAPAGDADDDCESETPSTASETEAIETEPTIVDDGFEAPTLAAPGGGPTAPLPFADLSDAAIESRLKADLDALGPLSVGRTNGGALVAAVRMPNGENWEVKSPGLAWGTQETIDALTHAIDAVANRFPDTPKAFVGDISARRGGHLHPHVSHQAGRDVDLSYYLTEGHRWYAGANAQNLDRARTWHLIRTLVADSDVDLILVDRQIQRLLKNYALEIGEDPAWLDQIFQVGGKSARPIIFHVKGHATHLHVRFVSPVARELGRRAYRFLVARHAVSPPTLYVTHTVKPGETLSHLAVRYKVTPDAIKKANALSSDVLRANKPYKIPQAGGGIPMPGPVVIPPRRTPPPPKAVAVANPPFGTRCRRVSLR